MPESKDIPGFVPLDYRKVVDEALGIKAEALGEGQWITDPSTGMKCWAPRRKLFEIPPNNHNHDTK
jgi:hypothetical protein